MILEKLGKIMTAQGLLAGAEDSENVIDLGAVANVGLPGAKLVIETNVVAGGGTTSTFTFDLVIANETTLDTVVSILRVVITGITDQRISVAGNVIAEFTVGEQIGRLTDATKRYLGLVCTLADGNGTASLTVNAAIIPGGMAKSEDNVQVTRSNVGVPT